LVVEGPSLSQSLFSREESCGLELDGGEGHQVKSQERGVLDVECGRDFQVLDCSVSRRCSQDLYSLMFGDTVFFFSINADRLSVKNGVLAGYCINSSKGKAKYS